MRWEAQDGGYMMPGLHPLPLRDISKGVVRRVRGQGGFKSAQYLRAEKELHPDFHTKEVIRV